MSKYTSNAGTSKLVELILNKTSEKEDAGMEELDPAEVFGDGTVALGTTGFKGTIDTENNKVVLKTYAGTETDVTVQPTYDIDGVTYNTSLANDSSHMFANNSTLQAVAFAGGVDTSNVIDMSYMFANDTALTSVDLQNVDTTNVTTMEGMFENSSSLEKVIVNEDTKNMLNNGDFVNTSNMFSNAGVDNVEVEDSPYSVPVGSVERISQKYFTKQIASRYLSDTGELKEVCLISGIDTSVKPSFTSKIMVIPSSYEENGQSYPVVYNAASDTCNLHRYMEEIYLEDGVYLPGSFVNLFSSYNLIKIHIGKIKYIIKDGSLKSAASMFKSMNNTLYQIDGLENLQISNECKYFQSMFEGCGWVSKLDLTGVNATAATNMSKMFYGCTKLTEILVSRSNWVIPANCNTSSMFTGCGTDHVTYID